MLSYTLSLVFPSGSHFLQASANLETFTKASAATISRWAFENGFVDFDRGRAKLNVYHKHQLVASKNYLTRKWNYDEGFNPRETEMQRLPTLSPDGTPKQSRAVRVVRKGT